MNQQTGISHRPVEVPPVGHALKHSYFGTQPEQVNADDPLAHIQLFARLTPVSYTHLTLPTNREV